MPTPNTLAIIAGNGVYPLLMARAARTAGVRRLVAAAFHDETDPQLVSGQLARDERPDQRIGIGRYRVEQREIAFDRLVIAIAQTVAVGGKTDLMEKLRRG